MASATRRKLLNEVGSKGKLTMRTSKLEEYSKLKKLGVDVNNISRLQSVTGLKQLRNVLEAKKALEAREARVKAEEKRLEAQRAAKIAEEKAEKERLRLQKIRNELEKERQASLLEEETEHMGNMKEITWGRKATADIEKRQADLKKNMENLKSKLEIEEDPAKRQEIKNSMGKITKEMFRTERGVNRNDPKFKQVSERRVAKNAANLEETNRRQAVNEVNKLVNERTLLEKQLGIRGIDPERAMKAKERIRALDKEISGTMNLYGGSESIRVTARAMDQQAREQQKRAQQKARAEEIAKKEKELRKLRGY